MAFAVIASGGKQFRVAPGDVIDIERVDGATPSITFADVLLVSDEKQVQVGTPLVAGAAVRGTVLGEVKGRKIRILNYQPKKRHQRHMGHRQRYTRVRIDEIDTDAAPPKAETAPQARAEAGAPATPAATPEPAAKPKATAKPRAKAKPKASPARAKPAAKPKAAAKATGGAKGRGGAKSKAAPRAKAKPVAKAKPKGKARAKPKPKTKGS